MERRRKLRLKQDFAGWLDQVLLQTQVREAPFNFAVAAAASRIHLPHRIWATSSSPPRPSSSNLTLVSADAHLIEFNYL